MWIYEIDKGVLRRLGQVFTGLYSGFGDAKNDPTMQGVHDRGPIPKGTYLINPPTDILFAGHHGPYVLPLTPDPSNIMYGRSGFLIHGDSLEHPGLASHGCIIAPRYAREAVVTSGDSILLVIENAAQEPPEHTE